MTDILNRPLKIGDVCVTTLNGEIELCIIVANEQIFVNHDNKKLSTLGRKLVLLEGEVAQEQRIILLNRYNKINKQKNEMKKKKDAASKKQIIGEWYQISKFPYDVIYWGKGKLTIIENGKETVEIGHFYRSYNPNKDVYTLTILPVSKSMRRVSDNNDYKNDYNFHKKDIPQVVEWEEKDEPSSYLKSIFGFKETIKKFKFERD